MRISEWSSDVCSSDLWASRLRSMRTGWVSCCVYYRPLPERRLVKRAQFPAVKLCAFVATRLARADADLERSEERREGKSVSVRVDLGGCSNMRTKMN